MVILTYNEHRGMCGNKTMAEITAFTIVEVLLFERAGCCYVGSVCCAFIVVVVVVAGAAFFHDCLCLPFIWSCCRMPYTLFAALFA